MRGTTLTAQSICGEQASCGRSLRFRDVLAVEDSAATADLLLMDLEHIPVVHLELEYQSAPEIFDYPWTLCGWQPTVSGLSVGVTRTPSNRKRQLRGSLP